MKRKPLTLKTKLASALLTMRHDDGTGKLVLIIPTDHARLMTDDQIISLFDFHHFPIPHAHGGPDEAWNIEPILRANHREITAKIDMPRIAKAKRIQERELSGAKQSALRTRGFQKRSSQRSASRPIERRTG